MFPGPVRTLARIPPGGSMADDKKPKIDLKARLGKTAMGGVTPPPAAAGGIPAPAPMPGGTTPAGIPIPAPSPNPVGVPVPPGIPVGPPPGFGAPGGAPGLALDPSNPLAAAVAPPASARSVPAPAPALQRIEVDEDTLKTARKGARNQGLMAGAVCAFVLGAVGFMAGSARETSNVRAQSVAHAKSLADDVGTSRDQLKDLADKLEAGRDALVKEKKFPEALVSQLGGINIAFDGSKLAGVRFSGFTTETTTGLIEFISQVQSTNDRKAALASLLSRLQKPMTEQLEAATAGKAPAVTFAVIVDRDSAKNPFAILAPLAKPLELSASMPDEFAVFNPVTRTNVPSAPKLTSLDKPGVAYVVPSSIEAVFPSETSGQIGQLGSQLTRLINDIRGETAAEGEAITEPKTGLLERADRLITGLNKVK